MQDTGPQWDPMTIDHVMPWEMRLFVFYLLFVLVFFLVRAMQLSWFLWRFRKDLSRPSGPEQTTPMSDLALASIRAVSLRRAAALTLLLSLTMSAEQGAKLLNSVSVEKHSSAAAVAVYTSELLTVFALGVGLCAALYAAFAIFEGRFSRLRGHMEHGQAANP